MPLTNANKTFIRKNYRSLSSKQMAARIRAKTNEVEAYIETLAPPLDARRERQFKLFALFLPVLLFLLLELALRLFNYGGNLDLFVTASGDFDNYYKCNQDVGKRYFFMQQTVPDPPNDLFLKQKPENGYRIFVVGGSTAAGYPYGNNLLFSRILQKRLTDAFPVRHIEVVNTAMTAINTYTILDYLPEILEQQPDAVLIYSGHNEFYGALGAASNESLGRFRSFVKFYLKLQRFKIFLLVRDLIGGVRNFMARTLSGGDVNKPTSTLMERMVGEQTIPYGSTVYEIGRRQYENNLRDILKTLTNHGVSVLIGDLVSNIRDLAPFVSVDSDSLPRADQAYAGAQRLEQEGDFEAARRKYMLAKDLDGLRFRATDDFNDVIRDVADEFQVPVVPVQHYFEQASPNEILGDNLMLEHLHPRAEGYFLMSDAFFDAMRSNGLISPVWDSVRIKPPAYYREHWGFTDLDRAYADIRIRILKGNWPFKPRSVPNRALIDYRPATKVDSVALKIWLEKGVNLEHGHVEMAEFYEKQGDYRRAFQEYRALTALTPFNSAAYLHAADMLIKARELMTAVDYLKLSLQLEETAFANKWLGQILLDSGRTDSALTYLERAEKMVPSDPQLIYNLSGAYALDGQYDKARASLERLDSLSPNFPGAADLKRQLDRL